MVGPDILRLPDGRLMIPDPHRHLGALADEDVDGDLVEGHLLDGVRCVARLVAGGAAVGARSRRVRLVVIHHFLVRYRRRLAVLITGYIIREEVPPRVMRMGEDVAARTRGQTRRLDGADVVAFAIVVPGDNLPTSISIDP